MSAPRRLIETASAGILSREETQAIIERTLKLSKADAARVTLFSGVTGNLRFADNQMSTAGTVENANLAVTSTFGAKHAVSSTNDFTDEGLRRVVEKSEALARLAPDDPEWMPELPPQQYQDIQSWFDTTASLTPEARARAAMTALEPARRANDLRAAGFIVTNATAFALGNSAGLFAYNRGTGANYTLTVRTADGTGSGWAGADHPDWTQLDFDAVAQRAIEKARLSRNPVAVEPGRYTVILEPARRANDLRAAGFIVTNATAFALGNSAGLFAYNRGTGANYTLTVRTADGTGSGWAGADHPDWTQLDFGAVAQRAIEKARLSRNPVAVEPGRYTVILEPQATADLVQLLAFALSARNADEGRSAFSKAGGGNKIGEQIVNRAVTLYSDPADPQLLGNPFDGEGMPTRRQVWIENGVLKNLVYSRFWARKQGKEPTGGAGSVKLEGAGGTASIEDMIRATPRGILVTRLWYLRPVDPRTVLYTGLTRDGTFLIEDGKISKSIRNLRFNESPLFLLNNVEMFGRPVRVAGTEAGGDVVVPPLKVRDFNFTSLSEAV